MKDSYGRKINYLRLSLTDKCNLKCKYCVPEKSEKKEKCKELLTLENIKFIIKSFAEEGINKVRLTGGEPLVRNDIVSIVSYIKKFSQIKDIAITTNGLLLEEMAEELKKAGLNRVNISLDSLKKEKYSQITRGGDLEKVLRGIDLAEKIGLGPIKLNVVLIKGFNDEEIEDFVNLTINRKIDVRFIELMPIGEEIHWSLEKYMSNEEVLNKISMLEKIENDNISSPAVYYKLPNSKGKIGLISPISCKFCDNCNRMRVTSNGFLKPCLHSNEEFDLKETFGDKEKFIELIKIVNAKKSLSHELDKGHYITRNMIQVGG